MSTWITLTRSGEAPVQELINADNIARAYPDLDRLAIMYDYGLLVYYRETLQQFKDMVDPPPPAPTPMAARPIIRVGDRVRRTGTDIEGVVTGLDQAPSLATVAWDNNKEPRKNEKLELLIKI